jgi:hypothetical protein
LSADAGVRQMGGGKGVKPLPKPFVLVSHGQRLLAAAGRGASFQSEPTGEKTSTTVAPSGPASPE